MIPILFIIVGIEAACIMCLFLSKEDYDGTEGRGGFWDEMTKILDEVSSIRAEYNELKQALLAGGFIRKRRNQLIFHLGGDIKSTQGIEGVPNKIEEILNALNDIRLLYDYLGLEIKKEQLVRVDRKVVKKAKKQKT